MREIEHVINLYAPGHAYYSEFIMTRCFPDESDYAGRHRQFILDKLTMQLVFALNQHEHALISQSLSRASICGAHKRGIVHSQRCEIVFVGEYHALSR